MEDHWKLEDELLINRVSSILWSYGPTVTVTTK